VPFLQHSFKKGRYGGALGSLFVAPLASIRLFLKTHLLVAMEISMLKLIIVGTASLAFVGTAFAADLPHPQPVTATAPVGKYPVGKAPVGKYPIGKAPAPAVVTKG
jgi:hypothetical protein